MIRSPRALPDGPVHFVGVCGAGQSALAWLLASTGRTVTGTDRACLAAVRTRLGRLGVEVLDRHGAEQIGDAACVVATDAVDERHPEIEEARRKGIPVMRRPEALASLCAGRRLVAVAGTHGKTT
ncbi:MAG: Mur ligase domain-containing protein, partial [Armatimonadota bacterium]